MRRSSLAGLVLAFALVAGLQAAAPTITNVSPATGTSAGGTQVNISGTGLQTVTSVTFGGTAAAILGAAPDGTALLVQAPAHANGAVAVVVTNPDGAATAANAFTYITPDGPDPTITGVTPNKGSTVGGTQVTITGTNFRANATVRFGDAAADSVTVVNGSTITATSPAVAGGGAGATVVMVVNSDSTQAMLPGGFTYAALCDADVTVNCITQLLKNGGAVPAGITALLAAHDMGAQISIVNTANSDRFELSPAITSSDEITVVVRGEATSEMPAFALSTGDIQSQGYRWDDTAKEATVILKPRASSWNGPEGCMLPPGTCAARASADYTAFALILLATPEAPPNTPPDFLANVQGLVLSTNAQTFSTPQYNPGGGSFGFSVGAPSRRLADTNAADDGDDGDPEPDGDPNSSGFFNFFLPNAFITNVWGISNPAVLVSDPAQLKVTIGGDTVTPAVTSVAATSTSPAGVRIAFEGFHYSIEDIAVIVAPTASGISPVSGPAAGGTSVTITGLNFRPGAAVSIGGVAATTVVVVNGTTITAVAPAHAAGAANVVVTNADGTSDTLAGGFTYSDPAPTVSAINPAAGPAAGGTAVTITGQNFRAGATVTFGGTAATSVVVASGTTITAVTPAHAAGAVNVLVTNSDGTNHTLNAAFTYHTCAGAAPMSGWVCVNGGWVPPDHPLATAPPPTTPACPGSAPVTGWLCVNGGWVPPDHPLAAGGPTSGGTSGGGSGGGSTGGSSGGTSSCPGTAPVTGWLCINGGWVPPDHPIALAAGGGSSSGGSAGGGSTGGSTACTTVKPVSDWVCVNGGWVPPDHPLARRGGS